MKLINTLVGISAMAMAALSPLSASAMVSADNPLGVTKPATTSVQQEAHLKPFWEKKGDFCILIIAICIEPDKK